MLADLQARLNGIYQVGSAYDVRDFLITDRVAAEALGQQNLLPDTEETLLVYEEDGELAVSLFLDAALLDRLSAADPLDRLRAHQLTDFWKVVEGVSHFNCVVWKASRDRPVSLLELELQAEIDKFVSTAQLAASQGKGDIAGRLHGWLFDDVSYRDDLDDEQRARYRSANDFAARYCHGLAHPVAEHDRAAMADLREFYRLPMSEKISRIRSRAWS